MKTNEKIARMVRYHRKKADLTQIQLAKLAGIGKSAVYDIEKGKETAQLDTLVKILEALNIKMKFESPLMAVFESEEPEAR